MMDLIIHLVKSVVYIIKDGIYFIRRINRRTCIPHIAIYINRTARESTCNILSKSPSMVWIRLSIKPNERFLESKLLLINCHRCNLIVVTTDEGSTDNNSQGGC